MAGVPRIEVHTCNVQGDSYSPPHSIWERTPVDSSPTSQPPSYDCSQLAEDKHKTISGTERRRLRFWSRLRRSLSDSGRGTQGTKKSLSLSDIEHSALAPRSASFAIRSHSHTRGCATNGDHALDTESRRPASATLPATQKFAGDDELEFHQLPGHYSLSVYDYVGGSVSGRSSASMPSSPDREQRHHRPTTPTIMVTSPHMDDGEPPARGWMSVASRLSTPERSP